MNEASRTASAPSHHPGRTIRLMVLIAILLALGGYATLLVLMNRPAGLHRYEIRSVQDETMGTLTIDIPIDFFPFSWSDAWPELRRSVETQIRVDYPSNKERQFAGSAACTSKGPLQPLLITADTILFALYTGRNGEVRHVQYRDQPMQLVYELLIEIH